LSESTFSNEASFSISAAVRNQSSGAASSSTLRYYLSNDNAITGNGDDVGLGTDPIGALAANATTALQNLTTAAPSVTGPYFVGACVDPVAGETNTGNQCSNALAVTVIAGTPPTVAITAPPQSVPTNEASLPEITGTASDTGLGVASVTLKIALALPRLYCAKEKPSA
jgi:hypothetical protein